jgi:hypothetical protein
MSHVQDLENISCSAGPNAALGNLISNVPQPRPEFR